MMPAVIVSILPALIANMIRRKRCTLTFILSKRQRLIKVKSPFRFLLIGKVIPLCILPFLLMENVCSLLATVQRALGVWIYIMLILKMDVFLTPLTLVQILIQKEMRFFPMPLVKHSYSFRLMVEKEWGS